MSFQLPLLPETYNVGPNDVIIGRGKKCTMNPGNLRFREIIKNTLDNYQNAETKVKKSDIIMQVLTQLRADNGVGFVKIDAGSGRFIQVEEASCRIAIAQAFRDALSGTYKSSKKHKQQRRLERKRVSATNLLAARYLEEQKQLQQEPVSRSIFDETASAPMPTLPKNSARAVNAGLSMFQLRDILQQASSVANTNGFEDSDASLAVAAFQNTVGGPFSRRPSGFGNNLNAGARRPSGFQNFGGAPFQRRLSGLGAAPFPASVRPAVTNSDIFASLLSTLAASQQQITQADPFEPTPMQTSGLPFSLESGSRAA